MSSLYIFMIPLYIAACVLGFILGYNLAIIPRKIKVPKAHLKVAPYYLAYGLHPHTELYTPVDIGIAERRSKRVRKERREKA